MAQQMFWVAAKTAARRGVLVGLGTVGTVATVGLVALTAYEIYVHRDELKAAAKRAANWEW